MDICRTCTTLKGTQTGASWLVKFKPPNARLGYTETKSVNLVEGKLNPSFELIAIILNLVAGNCLKLFPSYHLLLGFVVFR